MRISKFLLKLSLAEHAKAFELGVSRVEQNAALLLVSRAVTCDDWPAIKIKEQRMDEEYGA